MENVQLIPDLQEPKDQAPNCVDEEHLRLPGTSRNATTQAAKVGQFWRRLAMASTKGLFLIVPVTIMSMVPGRSSSLTMTCVSLIFFAIGVAWKTQLKEDQVMAATAAYAAVLVVFVGTSLANNSVKAY